MVIVLVAARAGWPVVASDNGKRMCVMARGGNNSASSGKWQH